MKKVRVFYERTYRFRSPSPRVRWPERFSSKLPRPTEFPANPPCFFAAPAPARSTLRRPWRSRRRRNRAATTRHRDGPSQSPTEAQARRGGLLGVRTRTLGEKRMHERDVPFLDCFDQIVIESVAARIPSAEARVPHLLADDLLEHRVIGLHHGADYVGAVGRADVVAARVRHDSRRGRLETPPFLTSNRRNIPARSSRPQVG